MVNGPEQSQESVTAAPTPQLGGEEGGPSGGGSGRTRERGSYGDTEEVERGRSGGGELLERPHFMQGTPTRPAAELHGAGGGWGQSEPPRQALGRPRLRREMGTAREQVPGRSAWVTSGKSATGFRLSLPQGAGLLDDCLGKEMAASRETSHTSSNSPRAGRGQRGAFALGAEEKTGRWKVPGEGVSGQQLASPHMTLLPRGPVATCPPCSQACPPLAGRPGTAPGHPGCS